MNYRAYFTDYQGNKRVITIDDISPVNVEQVVAIYYGSPDYTVLESDPQPADADLYQEVAE